LLRDGQQDVQQSTYDLLLGLWREEQELLKVDLQNGRIRDVVLAILRFYIIY